MPIDSLFQAIQKATLPGVWSKGISLSREKSVIEDRRTADEIFLRVQVANRPVSPRVTLWPQDEDWYCDCGDRNDPCIHIVAAVAALKNGTALGREDSAPHAASGLLHYRFSRDNGKLILRRWIVRAEREEPLTQSLVSYIGGITSGRIATPPVASTRDDFTVDQLICTPGTRADPIIPNPETFSRLLGALKDCSNVFFESTPIQVSGTSAGWSVVITDHANGIRVQGQLDSSIQEVFANGAVLSGGVLRPAQALNLTPEQREIVSSGKTYSRIEIPHLVAEVLPSLEKQMPVERRTTRLPAIEHVSPRIVLEVHREKAADSAEPELTVLAQLVYGTPAIATVEGQTLRVLQDRFVPVRDPGEEKTLERKLQLELHLRLGHRARYQGAAAVEFSRKLKDWDVAGEGTQSFTVTGRLEPRLRLTEDDFKLEFTAISGAHHSSGQASFKDVLTAWNEGKPYVPLLDGSGWAEIPSDWLKAHGGKILRLLAAKEAQGKLNRALAFQAVELCEELGQSYPDSLRRLKTSLEEFTGIPEYQLPSDVRANLRSYQLKGFHWLRFLRENGLGALLADDMGLGKTLQTLTAIEGRTLVVTPTSVLETWAEQIERFRPGLRHAFYYGPQRALDRDARITITSYGMLRMDQDILTAQEWDTVVLDEAQTIKNPDSQVAQAAHRLRAPFRIALTGTPIENHLQDLWSQFQFINPGLLGTRDDFQETFSTPLARGDEDAAVRLRRRIKPFILRRLKKEVAPELPPRTEIVLHCELSEEERAIYQALMAATREEVLQELQTSGNVIGALEALLRLRQASCHAALVPGQSGVKSSSKVELLLESLQESIDAGHRALVFSQWTSLLDLIEPELQRLNIRFSRLDGSTRNRDEIVSRFQAPDGPQAMLISLKAGGVGLTLTAADHVYIMDPWWNPAIEDQAASRAHRIGQENPVLVHRLVARDTVEDKILVLQKKKQELAATALDGAAAAVSLTKNDLIELLS